MNTLSPTAFLPGKRSCGVIVLCVLTAMAAHAQTFTTIASFDQSNGSLPLTSLIQGTDGNFYGTTYEGGNISSSPCISFGCGTVFKVTPAGQITTLYAFCSKTNCADGNLPWGNLVLGANGNFYGTTFRGGANNESGTVFEITPQGKLTTLHSFCAQTECPDGSAPISGLTLGPDGNFYGTTFDGGPNLGGTVYKISPTGAFTTIYSFCGDARQCKAGLNPNGPLVLATNGKLYGTTPLGGVAFGGTIFQLNLSGVESTVHAFSYQNTDSIGQSNGVMQAADGNLYGTTYEGPSNISGSVFKLTPTGQYTTLYTFCSQLNCSDGTEPESQLVQGTDGNLYGTTAGFTSGYPFGSIFQITTTGNLTTLYDFCPQPYPCADGNTPDAGLIQATNGTFYGVASGGGTSTNCSGGCGTFFSLDMGLAPFVQPTPNFGRAGRVVGILGNNLTGTTQVTFNGTPATFTVVSSAFLRATVPGGATTGTIRVTTPSGTLNSNASFQVVP